MLADPLLWGQALFLHEFSFSQNPCFNSTSSSTAQADMLWLL